MSCLTSFHFRPAGGTGTLDPLNTSHHTKHITNSLSLLLKGHFPGDPRLAGLLELRMMKVVSGDKWSCKMCKAPVKLSSSTNKDSTFTDRCPSCHPPTVRVSVSNMYVYMYVSMSVCLSVCLSVCVSVCMSVTRQLNKLVAYHKPISRVTHHHNSLQSADI